MSAIDKSKSYVVKAITKTNTTVYYCGGTTWSCMAYGLISAKIYKTMNGAEKAKKDFENSAIFKAIPYECREASIVTVEEAERTRDFSYTIISRNGHFYVNHDLSLSNEVEINPTDGKAFIDALKALSS